MELNPKPNLKVIQDLKAAGEELKTASVSASAMDTEGKKPRLVDEKTIEPETDLFKNIAQYQNKVSQKLLILEKARQEIKELEKKLERKIELLKGLQTKGAKINQDLKEFKEQLTLAQKEDKDLLLEIRNKLQ